MTTKFWLSPSGGSKRSEIDLLSSDSESDQFIAIDSDVEYRQPKRRKMLGKHNGNEIRGVKIGNGTFQKTGGFDMKDVEVVDLVDSEDGFESKGQKEQGKGIKDLERKVRGEERGIATKERKIPLGIRIAASKSNVRSLADLDPRVLDPFGYAIFCAHDTEDMVHGGSMGRSGPVIQNPATVDISADTSGNVMMRASGRNGGKHQTIARPNLPTEHETRDAEYRIRHSANPEAVRQSPGRYITTSKTNLRGIGTNRGAGNLTFDDLNKPAHRSPVETGSVTGACKSILIPSFELANASRAIFGTITVLRGVTGQHFFERITNIVPWESHQLSSLINNEKFDPEITLVRISNRVYNVKMADAATERYFAKGSNTRAGQDTAQPKRTWSIFHIKKKKLSAAEEIELMRSWVDAGIELVSRGLF